MENLVLEADDTLQVVRATTFGEATKMMVDRQPDVVLLDMNLPAGNSFGLLKQIKEQAYKTCVIALSIGVPVNIRQQCRELGADYLLDKFSEFDKIPALLYTIRAHKKQTHTT